MEYQPDAGSQELAIFRKLLYESRSVPCWTYRDNGELLYTNCSENTAHTFFQLSGCLDYALSHFRSMDTPLVLGAQLGVLWGAAVEQKEDGFQFHVIGPCLSGQVSTNIIEETAYSMIDNIRWRRGFISFFQRLSTVPMLVFQEYLLMLHYCIRAERLQNSDIHLQSSNIQVSAADRPKNDRYQTYMAEKALLYCVREGDLNYKESLARAGSISSGIRVTTKNPLNQAILSVSGFVTLCTRAAIEGGLSPDTAYSVGDSYIQSLMGCKSITEIGAISSMMYEDFIQRVHKERFNADRSRAIRDCMEYIELHPEEELSIQSLASRFGYTDYYLSHKFRKEVGESLNSYINYVRIERAKLLLETTNQSISDIALSLRYCSSNYFSDTFRKIVGISPIRYRKEKQQ